MTQIIYKAKYFCEICNEDIVSNVYGSQDTLFSEEEKVEVADWAKHYHWIEKHRLCCICGELVLSKDLELVFNDGMIKIHKEYNDEYKQVKRGDSFSNLLIVHRNCVEKKK